MENFECPPGFQAEISSGVLFLEDVDENSDLWLLRMPADVNPSDIDKKKIFLNQESETLETESGKVIEFSPEIGELPNLYAVLPRRVDNKLQVLKQNFQGSIVITECLSESEKTVIKNESEDNANCSTIGPQKKKKKSKSKDTDKSMRKDVPPSPFAVKDEPMSSDKDDFPHCKSQVKVSNKRYK